jgi:uncharacterized protein
MRRTVVVAAALAAAGCTAVFFQPNNRLYDHPDKYKLRYETPHFPSTDGTPLTGLFLFARKQPVLGTVVHFHGNGGNFTAHFRYTDWLVDEGFHVFVFDYRGYGNSGGHPSPEGVVQDGIAALRYVRGRPDVDPSRVFVLGQSLGGAVAVVSTVRSGERVAALALDSPMSSYRSVAREKLKANLFTRLVLRPLTFVLVSDAASARKEIAKLAPTPLLILHGDADPIVPYREGVALFDSAREPKAMETIEGARHTEAFVRFGSTYRPKLVDFFRQAVTKTVGTTDARQ